MTSLTTKADTKLLFIQKKPQRRSIDYNTGEHTKKRSALIIIMCNEENFFGSL
jgi:hypothetical protein